ncbi:MAG: hypothetical protein IJ306_08175, partial [Oscillospiraceae bacterium]|nr:hypothetical protein [Oscillospiraceae bacterium]
FCQREEVYDINLVDDKLTKEMHRNLGAGTWEVKLHGNDPEGTMRITTDRAHVVVESYGSLEEGAPLPEVPLSAAEQIDAKAQEALDAANSVRADADAGVFDGEKGEAFTYEDFTEEQLAALKGKDGFSPVVELAQFENTAEQKSGITVTVHYEDGSFSAATVYDGEPGADGKTAFEYAAEGGYSGTEEEFSKKLAEEPFFGNTEDTAPTEVLNAAAAGRAAVINHTDEQNGVLFFTNFAAALDAKIIVSSAAFENSGAIYNAFLLGSIENDTWTFSVVQLARGEVIPEVTADDNGKILQAVEGNWKAVAVGDSAVAEYVDEYIASALEGDY